MKNLYQKLYQFTIVTALLGLAVFPAHAFTSMYVFGDALSTTTNNTQASSFPKDYYGNRYANGRVWVEVLAQRQGIGISNNWSYFDCTSSNLVNNVKNFNITQQAANNALFVVWVNNSDLFDAIYTAPNTNQSTYVSIINRAQTNEFRAITNLYAKGVRTLLMPNAVDLGKVPNFCNPLNGFNCSFIRQECVNYNIAFSNTLNQARVACPGLTIYQPNFFGLLDNVISNAAYYGLTNALASGVPTDAMDFYKGSCTTNNGLGANYIYWDYLDPSARFQAIIADYTQQIISPVQIAGITALNNGSNQLAVVNVPMGLNGSIEVCTNLTSPNWTALQGVGSQAPAQSYFVPTPVPAQQAGSQGLLHANGITPPGPGGTVIVTALQFYRLNYPYTWNWP